MTLYTANFIPRGKGQVAMLLGPSGAPTFKNLADGYARFERSHQALKVTATKDGYKFE